MKFYKYSMSAIFIILCSIGFASAQQKTLPKADVVYVPTSEKVVDAMLKLAKVTDKDLVYDLGCGDGRIVIRAAKDFGAKGIGIEINPELVKKAEENAKQAKVENKVSFVKADIFKTNFKRATVIMLYLSPGVNLNLRPQLLKQLKTGTRIVSHDFGLGDWQPEQTIKVDEATLYLWTVPAEKPKFNKK